jgi:hypothetical protein
MPGTWFGRKRAKVPRPNSLPLAKSKPVLRLLLFFLIPSISAQAVEVLRDRHADKEYVFEADQSEISATVDAAEATATAIDWAIHFYDDLLHVEGCEFRDKPTRFWLITFAQSDQKEKVYAIVLPDGTIVEPHTLTRS